MCLFAARAPCKTTPAHDILSPSSPSSIKPKTMNKRPFSGSFWKCKVTNMCLVRFSLPFLYFGLTFLLVPQACANPHLSSCPLDPSVNPYRMLMDEKSCFFSCFETIYWIVFVFYIAFCLMFVLNDYLNSRRKKAAVKRVNARIVEQEEIA